MNNMKLLTIMIFLVLLIQTTEAAVIQGTIYDNALKKMDTVLLKVNTTPEQTFLSKDGKYSFELEKGDYLLTAYSRTTTILIANENISITKEGDYIIDLFLFPSLEDEEDLFQEIDFTPPEFEESKSFDWKTPAMFAFVFLIGVILFFLPIGKKKPKDENEEESREGNGKRNREDNAQDTDLIIQLLKKEGRLTQKELRRQLPYSEAKVSLMVAELEHKKKIKKIKKGRANIILLEGEQ